MFHLAAQTLVGIANRAPLSTFETNIRGTWLLLEACRAHGVERVVVASSDKAYGRTAELPYREHQPLQPMFPYDVSKAAADLHRPLLLAHVRAAGGGHAVRQPLRRWGHEPLAAGARGGGRGARRPARR